MGTKVTTVINPTYQAIAPFIASIPDIFHRTGNTIYKERNEIKVMKTGDLTVNVKQYKKPIFINRLIYSFLRPSKAERAYKYALKISKIGIATPTPIAYIIINKNGLISLSYLITVQSDLKRNFYEFGKGGIEERKKIIQDLAVFTADMHQKGVYHKDFSPGNILFDTTPDGHTQFSIVDINRMQFGEVSIKKGCENFARLWGKKDMFELLAQSYAKERKADPKKCIEWTLNAREKFWKNRKHDFYEYE
ncbi:MAG: tyrosine protein kinase [Bacteroidetes bacterium]|uniref:Tyrosine protein kinase n=1 Tax=Candidatus Gallipaludibacter merdavium TaxID=2840839 RepID=A0A9D9N509_9BACT|nr:tyrosine protein kinase [Candidatus Gallipaludibacter merdavium]